MSYWDLMDSGSYNGDGYCPAGYTSYERWVAGWLEPIVLTDSMTVEGMQALQDGGNAYIMYNDGHPDEYFLLENRQHIGWDQGIPGHGHVSIRHSLLWLLSRPRTRKAPAATCRAAMSIGSSESKQNRTVRV